MKHLGLTDTPNERILPMDSGWPRTMTNPFILYGRSGSGSLAVQVALEEIGAPYERIWVSRDPAEVAEISRTQSHGKSARSGLAGWDADVRVRGNAGAFGAALSGCGARAEIRHEPARALFTVDDFPLRQCLRSCPAHVLLRSLLLARPARTARRFGRRASRSSPPLLWNSWSPASHHVLGAEYSIADVYLYMLASWYPNGNAELHARLLALGEHAALMLARPAVAKVEAAHASPAAS